MIEIRPMTGNNKRAMDWFDRKVLQYVLFWAPAGGMEDDDVFPEFGMRVEQLNERFNTIISTLSACSNNIDDTDRDLLARARRHQLSGRVKHGSPSCVTPDSTPSSSKCMAHVRENRFLRQ
jgi:hypothetical protein